MECKGKGKEGERTDGWKKAKKEIGRKLEKARCIEGCFYATSM